MIGDNEMAKEIEKAISDDVKIPLKGNGTRLGNVTLAVEMDAVIASLHNRIKSMEVIKAAVEALRATL